MPTSLASVPAFVSLHFLVVAEKSDVLQDEGVVCLGIDHALAPCGIETDRLMVGDAVAECLDLLQFVGGIFAFGYHCRYVIQRVVLMWRVFQHPSALQLMVYPIGIVEMGHVVLVDGVTKNNLEDIQHSVKLLSQFYVMPVERQRFVGVASARILVLVEPCSRKSILKIFIFHNFFVICLHN